MKVLQPKFWCTSDGKGGLEFPDLGIAVPKDRVNALEVAAEAVRRSLQLRRAAVEAVLSAINPASSRAQLKRQRQLVVALEKVNEDIEDSKISRLETQMSVEDERLNMYEALKDYLDDVVEELRASRSSVGPSRTDKLVEKALAAHERPDCMTSEGGHALEAEIKGWLKRGDDPEAHGYSRPNTSAFALKLIGKLTRTSAKAVLDGNTSARKQRQREAAQLELAYKVLERTPRTVGRRKKTARKAKSQASLDG